MKKIIVITLTVVMLISFCACNRVGMFMDVQNQANWAIVKYPNDSVYIYRVTKWSEDTIGYTITTSTGDVMFIDSMNCILTKNKPDESLGKVIE